MLQKIKKRDGTVVSFTKTKIKIAIEKSLKATKTENVSEALTNKVVEILEKKFGYSTPDVEDVQDTIEEVLLHKEYTKAASAYILYRNNHKTLRAQGLLKEQTRIPNLSINALKILQRRYLKKDEEGFVIETPNQLFRRVARTVASIDKHYKGDVATAEEEFYRLMINLEFLPNSPTLMNAGIKEELGLSACYVLPIEDSLESIFTTLKYQALIHQGGGGTGFSFSQLRPKGDIIASSKGTASGPVSFMKIFDTSTEIIRQGGRRRGANMAILNADHPDIEEFVDLKLKEGVLENFNISVAASETFMNAVLKNKEFALLHPNTKKIVKKIKARTLWKKIIENAWKTGDPGLLFIDEINKQNQLPEKILEATNPCGEQALFPYESCVLGSINLTKMIENETFDWEKLARTIKTAVHFLDNIIDANKLPLPEIEKETKANRRIGLGIMGWAETLILLHLRYDSNNALKLAEKLMSFIQTQAIKSSQQLAQERGSFENFPKSTWKKKYKTLRNLALTTIAPTGSISIIAGTSSGIEPLFAISFTREVMEGTKLPETNKIFEKIAKEKKFYSKKLITTLSSKGTLKSLRIPTEIKKLFITAYEISPEWHVKMQAAFQKYTDNGVSKTINLPENAKTKDVEKAYFLAYTLKCKGITVFRNKSKKNQVLSLGKVHSEFSGGCLTASCE